MFNEKFWLAISFFTFLTIIIKLVKPILLNALDNRSKKIAEDIQKAKEARQKAEQLLADAEKFLQDSNLYVEKLIRDAEIEALKFLSESKKSAEDEVNRKTAATLSRIKMEEEKAIRDFKAEIVEKALQNLSKNISKDLNKEDQEKVILNAISNFEKTVH